MKTAIVYWKSAVMTIAHMLDDLEAVIRRHLRQINSLAEFDSACCDENLISTGLRIARSTAADKSCKGSDRNQSPTSIR